MAKKGYKYRIDPSGDQIEFLNKTFGCTFLQGGEKFKLKRIKDQLHGQWVEI
jgi:hypothetical protein